MLNYQKKNLIILVKFTVINAESVPHQASLHHLGVQCMAFASLYLNLHANHPVGMLTVHASLAVGNLKTVVQIDQLPSKTK